MASLEDKRQVLVSYLLMKVNENDWHGVADAAMDLREVEAEIKWLATTRIKTHHDSMEKK